MTDEAVVIDTETVPLDRLEPSPQNLRRKPRDGQAFKQLVDSVKARGVLEPLLVTPNGGDKYVIVAGHRRFEAAKEAGLSSVQVLVRTMTDAELTEVMLIENLQRSDLLPSEEATGYVRLVELGMKKSELARRVGRSAAHVTERMRLLELPAKVRNMVDAGDVPLGAVSDLLKLDRDDMLAVVEQQPHNYDWAVQNRLRQRKIDETIAKARALAESSGYPVVEYEYHLDGKTMKLGNEWGELRIDKRTHRKESCHALAILTRGGAALEVCTDPKRHAVKGESEVKAPEGQKLGKSMTDSEKKQRDDIKAKKQRNAQRREEVAALLKGKLSSDAVAMALKAFVLDANQTQLKSVCKLLDIELSSKQHNGYESAEGPLIKFMEGPTKITKAAVALSFVLLDEAWGSGELSKHVNRWLTEQGVTKA